MTHHLRKNLSYLQNQQGLSFSADPTLGEMEKAAANSGFSLDQLFYTDLEALEKFDWGKISFVILDVDGVMTDGGMYYTESGDEFKKFNTKDGMAIKHGIKAGIQFALISSGHNENLIRRRAELFGIKKVYVGHLPKITVAEEWQKETGFLWEQLAMVGDDINDIPIFEKAGISACPADACERVKSSAQLVLSLPGGKACVREFMLHFPNLKEIL